MKSHSMHRTLRGSFKRSPVTLAMRVALAIQIPANLASANAGFASDFGLNNARSAHIDLTGGHKDVSGIGNWHLS